MRQVQTLTVPYLNKILTWPKVILCSCFARTAHPRGKAGLPRALPSDASKGCCSSTHFLCISHLSRALWEASLWNKSTRPHWKTTLAICFEQTVTVKQIKNPCMCYFPIRNDRENKSHMTDASYATCCPPGKHSCPAVDSAVLVIQM